MRSLTASQYKQLHTAVREVLDQYSSYFDPTDGWDHEMSVEIVERVADVVTSWESR